MARIPLEALKLVQQAWEKYREGVEKAGLRPSARDTYLVHSEQFVRWLNDDFTPGANLRRRRPY